MIRRILGQKRNGTGRKIQQTSRSRNEYSMSIGERSDCLNPRTLARSLSRSSLLIPILAVALLAGCAHRRPVSTAGPAPLAENSRESAAQGTEPAAAAPRARAEATPETDTAPAQEVTPSKPTTAAAVPQDKRNSESAAAPERKSGTLTGMVELIGSDRTVQPGADAVIWVPGTRGISKGPMAVTSKDKRFEPHVMAVARGTRVTFPNVDRIYHNAFSRTPGTEFDLGLYRNGASRDVKLDQPGIVRVFCNIHPKMAAYVLVIDDAAFVVSSRDGSFRIPDLPPGRHTVKVWHEKQGEQELNVNVVAGRETFMKVRVDASRFVEAPHKNKRGEDYPKESRRADERY